MKVAIATLGCKVNLYDSATIESRLRGDGCQIVPFGPGADTYVINTCSVTDRADAESRRLARRARRFGPAARVVMTGCFAQSNPRGASLPEVDFVVGLNRLDDLLAAIKGELSASAGRVLVSDLRRAEHVGTLGAETFCGQTRAFLKIQEGCDLFCTFCIVPFSRGRSRSVPPRAVLEQMRHLGELGYREIVLTGVHLGTYGGDLKPALTLTELVEMIAADRPVPRVRLSSVDPPEITPRLLSLVAESDILCPHFHVPIQSVADDILRRMRRRYDAGLVREVIAAIRRQIPLAGIGTDVIAGFPGESDAEFAATEAAVWSLPFTYLHVFPYSPRQGTTAAKLAGRLPALIVTQRARRLRAIDGIKRREFAARMVGKKVAVLLERGSAAGETLSGYARNYARVAVRASPKLANCEVSARVIKLVDNALEAEIT